LIGGLAGGPVDMAAGADSGAAAELASALVTGRKQVNIPAGTLSSFRLPLNCGCSGAARIPSASS